MKSSLTLLVLALLLVNFSGWMRSGTEPVERNGERTRRHRRLLAWAMAGGFIAPFVFLASLFKSNLGIYEVHNNGAWYNFGYLFGLACFFGEAARGRCVESKC